MKYIKSQLIKLLESDEILQAEFKRRFKQYEFPFESADAKIRTMNEAQRMRYYNDAKELLSNTAFKGEFEELIRVYYQRLAIKTMTELDITTYRLVLIAIKELQDRFNKISPMYAPPKASNPLNKLN